MRHQGILETETETASWLLKQHSYNYFLHFSFCFILIVQILTELRPFKCQGRPVSLWRWPLTCDLEKCYSFGMYNRERRLRYSHFLTRHCPCNLLPEQTSHKHEYRGQIWGHPVMLSMTSSPWKYFFGMIWDGLFISEVKLKLWLIFRNCQNGRHFEVATNVFAGYNIGRSIYQKDSHEYFRYFELLIDALAEILMGMNQF